MADSQIVHWIFRHSKPVTQFTKQTKKIQGETTQFRQELVRIVQTYVRGDEKSEHSLRTLSLSLVLLDLK